MLQWTGGSRRKVATSRKSTHNRQKQYFEQRKRQRQVSGQENCANGGDKLVLRNAEPRSLDIVNLINLAVTSQPACAEHTASVDSGVAKISDDSLLGKVSRNFSTVLETRLEQQKNFSDSNLPQVSGNDSYQCTENVNKYKMPGSISDHTSTWKDDTFKEKPRIEATVLDLLGDDGPSSNGRSIPETHVALSVDGLGKIGCQTPAHSPRMQNRFSCKGISMESKASRQVRSTSALQSIYDGCNEELDEMIDDFRVSPLCNKSGTWAYNTKATLKSRVGPVPPYCHEDQVDKITFTGKDFDACLLASNEKHSNDSFGYLEKQFIGKNYDASSHNQRFSFVGHPFQSSTTKKFEKYEASDVGVRDTFLGSSRNLWEGGEIFEASATSAPHFRHSSSEKESTSFIWESDDTNADGMFKLPTLGFLSTKHSEDYESILSEDLNSNAARKKSSLNFGIHSMKLGENKRNSSDEFYTCSGEGKFMENFSQIKNIFTGFDDEIWGKKEKGNNAFEKSDVENIFLPGQVSPSDDPFNNFTMRSTTSSGNEAMLRDDHFDMFPPPQSNFKVPFECEGTNNFINQNEMFGKKMAFEFNSQIPMKPSTKAKSFGQYSSNRGDFFKETHCTHLPKYQEYNEDRGSSGKPPVKDYEKRSTSSGNAESAAGEETLSKVSEHEESKNEIPVPFDSQRVVNSHEETEVIPTVMEELPTQIQKYVHSKLNQFQGRSPVAPHPCNEESKATLEPETKEVHSECGGNGDASYQVMLQSYVLQLLCVQKVLLEASEKDIKKV
ncbi:uncharacterized protein LOC110107392 isoform X3 [Dendrobium catenatum]|uniref:uncharacterized protein LOC110107392 isoform X3 n=1 Tax=Dendrobium catenatum TaxID=906689 RepID=UPI0009F250E9|nr:uncharacterized protein LOC110107392 isoform X3 [Dendrobium catenatum]